MTAEESRPQPMTLDQFEAKIGEATTEFITHSLAFNAKVKDQTDRAKESGLDLDFVNVLINRQIARLNKAEEDMEAAASQ